MCVSQVMRPDYSWSKIIMTHNRTNRVQTVNSARLSHVHVHVYVLQADFYGSVALYFVTMVSACAVGTTILHISSGLYQYCGTTQLLLSWSATTSMLLEHQVFTPRTVPAVGQPLVTDSDRVIKHASLVPRPQFGKQTSGVRVLTGLFEPCGRHTNHDITGRLFMLMSRSKYAHMAIEWYL